jgi:hypothetical protein
MLGDFKFSIVRGKGQTKVLYRSYRGLKSLALAHLCVLTKKDGFYSVETRPDLAPCRKRWDMAHAFLKAERLPWIESRAAAVYASWRSNPRRSVLAMSAEQANAVYDVLVGECSASEEGVTGRNSFVYAHTKEIHPCQEYRFGGMIGFGGKFRNAYDRWCVDCYKEEEDVESLGMLCAANEKLQALYLSFFGKQP